MRIAGMLARALPLAIVALVALVAACSTPGDVPGVPLYPNAAATRLPRAQIAVLYGPIGLVDGQSVAGQGGVFELLPGCHVIELERRVVSDTYSVLHGARWTGEYAPTVFALRMKPGARYVIRREISADSTNVGNAHVNLSAREEEASGATTALDQAKSPEDLKACKEWEAAAAR